MINVVICHDIINTAHAPPIINILKKLTLPRYSGVRNKDDAPNTDAKRPATVANNTSQNTSNN
jgi:hypothetical protein